MTTLDTTIASLPGTRLSLGGLLRRLHTQGRLGPLVLEALAEHVVLEQARQAGLSVTADELQAAADAFRRSHALHTAAATRAWMDGRGLTVHEFQAALEERLLAAKLKTLRTAGADEYFSARRADFERLTVARVLVGRDDLARELASQVRDEGRGLEEVAREHRLPLARHLLFRKDVGGPLAEALASAGEGELAGPVATPEGFLLAVVEERRPAELDTATRQHIRDLLFGDWLAGRMSQATLDLRMAGTPA